MLAVTRDDFVTAGEVMAMSVVQGGPRPNFLAREIYNVVSRSFDIEELKDESLKETCVKVQIIYISNSRQYERLYFCSLGRVFQNPVSSIPWLTITKHLDCHGK